MPDVTVVDLGIANRASILNAFGRLGVACACTADPDDIQRARRLVLPGVGAFGAGMRALEAGRLTAAVRDAIASRVPTLGICLGFQLLCDGSAESPRVPGIGVIAGTCRRLPSDVRVPHLGWNTVHAPDGPSLVTSGVAAFANSYALREAPPGWTAGWTMHGTPFVATLERDAVLACQFHPELSGEWGMALLDRWLRGAPVSAPGAQPGDGGLCHRLIPCLDVRDGRVVKGVRFQGLRDAGDPARRAARYAAQGADEIVLLDVAASPRGKATHVKTVRAVRRALTIPLTVGGGIRSVQDAAVLLDAGADKVSVNTAAVRRPELITELADAFGSQCVVLAIDARRANGAWEVLVNGGRDSAGGDALAWARRGTSCGAGEILLTSWDRDGTRAGCDLALLRGVRTAVSVPVIASGGAGTPQHVVEAIRAGADAVLAASIFHDDDTDVGAVKRHLAGQNLPVRL